MRYLALLLLSLLLTSCAFTRDYVSVDYSPQCEPQKICGAENVDVSVSVTDRRTNPQAIGCKINGFGMECAYIMAENNISEVFTDAIIFELQQRGFNISSGDKILDVELCQFKNDFKSGFFHGSAEATAIMNVNLKLDDGTIVFHKNILGAYNERVIFLATGKNAALSLNKALNTTIQQLVNDPDFITALLKNGHTNSFTKTS